MIISHKYKFIFIKTRKTAGSSIEKVLLDYIDPTDIFGGMGFEKMDPINCDIMAEHKDWRWIYKNYPTEWNNYFKFAVERNPWDKAVSFYYWYGILKPGKVKKDLNRLLCLLNLIIVTIGRNTPTATKF